MCPCVGLFCVDDPLWKCKAWLEIDGLSPGTGRSLEPPPPPPPTTYLVRTCWRVTSKVDNVYLKKKYNCHPLFMLFLYFNNRVVHLLQLGLSRPRMSVRHWPLSSGRPWAVTSTRHVSWSHASKGSQLTTSINFLRWHEKKLLLQSCKIYFL